MRNLKIFLSSLFFILILNLPSVISQSDQVSTNLQRITIANASNLEFITQIDVQRDVDEPDKKPLTDVVVCGGDTQLVVELNDFRNLGNDSLTVWNWQSNSIEFTLQDKANFSATKCSPNRQYLVTIKDTETQLWDMVNSEFMSSWEVGFSTSPPEFSPNSHILAFTSDLDNRLTLWNIVQNRELAVFQDIPYVSALAFDSNSDYMVVGDEEGIAYTISIDEPDEQTILFQETETLGIVDIAFSPNSEFLAFAGFVPPNLYVWSLPENRLVLEDMGILNTFYFRSRESRIADVDRDGVPQLFVLETGEELPTLIDFVPAALNEANTMIIDSDAERRSLVLIDIDTNTVLFDFQTIEELDLDKEHVILFAPEDNYIIFAQLDGVITILGIR